MEHSGPERIWVLCERQSGCRSSALESGDRASDRGANAAQDAHVQWIRRAGRRTLHRYGFGVELLGGRRARRIYERMKDIRFAKLVLLVNALVPGTLLLWDVWHGRAGANPINYAIRTLGLLALIFLVLSLLVTPLRKIKRLSWLIHLRRLLGLFAFFYALAHFLTFFIYD